MYYLSSILIIIASILLILIVLVQNAKGGGLAAGFSSSNQVMGVRKTADFLEKATWALAIGLVVFCLVASMTIPAVTQNKQSEIKEQVDAAIDQVPNYPTQVQQQQQTGTDKQPQQQENKNK
jgi:preprotein translocase subunit SecG